MESVKLKTTAPDRNEEQHKHKQQYISSILLEVTLLHVTFALSDCNNKANLNSNLARLPGGRYYRRLQTF